ncbi:MAG: hypothetical protein ABSB60_08520 [Terracidiphilus sp.]|jgi:hypothetical protein
MKLVDCKYIYLMVLVGCSLNLIAQSRDRERTKLATDPLFGMEYDPKIVQHELLPQIVVEKCYANQGVQRAMKERLGIYAHVHSGSADYYIVDSTLPYYNEYGWVEVLFVEGDKCTRGSSDWAFSSRPSRSGYSDSSVTERIPSAGDPDIKSKDSEDYYMRSAHEEEVMRNLAKDAIRRAIAALGSDAVFKKQVCVPTSASEESSYPVLDEELSAYCKKTRSKQ